MFINAIEYRKKEFETKDIEVSELSFLCNEAIATMQPYTSCTTQT